MSTELATLPDRPAPTLPALLGVDLVGAFLSGRNPRTLKAYAKDLDDFARWLGSPSSSAAVELLLSGTGGQANTVALGYKVALIERKLAAATIARRLAALRSMVKLARTLGRVAWTLEVEGPKSEAYRDTRGPGLDGWRDLLAEARTHSTPRRACAISPSSGCCTTWPCAGARSSPWTSRTSTSMGGRSR